MSGKLQKIITVRTAGKPDIELAAELFAPLILKIHKRNQAGRSSKSRARKCWQRIHLSGTEFATPRPARRKVDAFTA